MKHFSKSTVEATVYCPKCGRSTRHRVDKGRLGPCLDCIERLEAEHKTRVEALRILPAQEEMFR